MQTPRDKSSYVVLAAIFVMLLLSRAGAVVKQFAFHGKISFVVDHIFAFDGSITNDGSFEGFYVFDTTAADSSSDPTVGDYRYTNRTFGVVVKAGNYVFRTDPRQVSFQISVGNRPDGDYYVLNSVVNVCSQRVGIEYIYWPLSDDTGTALNNDLLPLTPPALAAWQSWSDLEIGSFLFFWRGTVTSISEVPVIPAERPAVKVEKAVEVKWQSQLGNFYQLQSSEDRLTWTNVGEPVLGDGTELSKFFSRDAGRPAYYRVELANFEK